ncbi:hypothetical protein MYMAC_004890 [Corallococcus macrosporus DSM 14697]|uniref:Uncharacterized protein n=1 Tax=Corallococcus macrosporus DSM 14697 TaxID=1189310 RepID=A0A250JZY3_9BACT|nr:hypothetical protein MYMAC_004890 [Corallococcus macrosporus DSM 14697]
MAHKSQPDYSSRALDGLKQDLRERLKLSRPLIRIK